MEQSLFPDSIDTGSPFEVSKTFWWASRKVSNMMYSQFKWLHPVVQKAQNAVEQNIWQRLDEGEQRFRLGPNSSKRRKLARNDLSTLVNITLSNAEQTLQQWEEMPGLLATLYGDGYVT